MVVKIQKSNKEEYNDTLKLSKMMPFEYVVMSKNFADPIKGVSQYGDWFLYSVNVEEYKTMDAKTGEQKVEKPNQDFSYFANTPKVHELLESIPANTKFKLRAEEVEGKKGTFTKFVVDMLDEVSDDASNENSAPGETLESRLKTLKNSGVSKADAISILSKEFEVSDAIIGGKYDAI